MTTNQTIDGVPRELLERCARELSIGIGPAPKNRAQELRALLDAERCSSCDDSGDLTDLTGEWRGYCICPIGVVLKNRPAAQPQGEPVAWMDPRSPEMHATISNEVKQHNLKFGGAPSAAVNGYSIPLYAEQPAPVADPLAKGFTTLESDSGKYKIVTSFATRDDAWSAYRALLGAKPASVAVQLLERFADYAESGKVAEPSMAEALRSYLNTK